MGRGTRYPHWSTFPPAGPLLPKFPLFPLTPSSTDLLKHHDTDEVRAPTIQELLSRTTSWGLSLQRILLLAWQALLINFSLLQHAWIQDSRHAGQVLYHWIMSSAPHWVMLSRGSITESCPYPLTGDSQQVPCHWAIFPSLQWSIQILNPSAEWSTHYIDVAMDCWSLKRPP